MFLNIRNIQILFPSPKMDGLEISHLKKNKKLKSKMSAHKTGTVSYRITGTLYANKLH